MTRPRPPLKRIGVGGPCRGFNGRVPHYRSAPLSVTPSSHEGLRSVHDPCAPSACLLHCFASSFKLDAVLPADGYSGTPSTPQCRPLLPINSSDVIFFGRRSPPVYTCNETRGQCLSTVISILTVCLDECVGVGKLWPSCFLFRQPRHQRSREWWTCRSLS